MNQAQALAKARKLLGAKAAIVVRNSVPVGDERRAEIEQRRIASERLIALKAERDARRAYVLNADAEYQRLRSEASALEKERDNLHAIYHNRVTIVTADGWFNHVRAEGDNFDEAVAALEAKQREAA